MERSTQATRSEAAAAPEQEPVHTWEDGDRTMRVVLQNDLVVQKTAANTARGRRGARREPGTASSGSRPGTGPDASGRPGVPLRVGRGADDAAGRPRVLLALDPGWDDDAQVEGFFSNNEIPAERVSELGFLRNGFLIETEPGFPSLELANALAGQEGVLISSPNWRTEVEAK